MKPTLVSRTLTISLLAMLALGPASHALASGKAGKGQQVAAASQNSDVGAAEVKTANVSGFRSAHFGMTEKQVRSAISADFRIAGDDVRSSENKLERTRILTVNAPNVLPGGGKAEVSYVFGYESKKLIQVGVVWSKASDEKMSAEQLFSNANVLRNHFVSAGYKRETVAVNMPIAGGLLMFRGLDAEARTTLLMLQGDIKSGKENQRILTPTSLMLFYVADPKTPDVYRLPAGSF